MEGKRRAPLTHLGPGELSAISCNVGSAGGKGGEALVSIQLSSLERQKAEPTSRYSVTLG